MKDFTFPKQKKTLFDYAVIGAWFFGIISILGIAVIGAICIFQTMQSSGHGTIGLLLSLCSLLFGGLFAAVWTLLGGFFVSILRGLVSF